jgi:hypothetical protein
MDHHQSRRHIRLLPGAAGGFLIIEDGACDLLAGESRALSKRDDFQR